MLLNIDEMTTEQKLGMLFCARRFEDADMDFILEMIKKRALGCVQPHAENPEIVQKLISAADYPILVINDTETGFPTSALPKIPLMCLSACDDKAYYRAFAKGIVRDAQKMGYNGTWGPAIDILRMDGPERVSRIASDDPQKVAEVAEEIADVFKQNHYLSTGKHYPGGEDCPFDTHMTEGTCNLTEEEIVKFDLMPYLHLMKKDLLPAIMTQHIVYKKIDPKYPASLSKKVIDIIRNLGFDGVVFTDSFAMMGILQKYGEDKIYGMAVEAGNDIILPNYRTPVKEAFNMLVQNYKDGAFTEERLNEAALRVLRAQAFVGEKPNTPTVFTKEDEEMLHNVARDCITAVTDEGVPAYLTGEDKDRLFVVLTPNTTEDDRIQAEISMDRWYFPHKIAEKIKQTFPESGIEFLPEFANAHDNERVLNAATKYKEVVFVTFCATTCYLGTDCLTRRTEAVINALIQSDKVSCVLHFGNPFALKTINHVKRKIFGYIISESQMHAIDVLKGKIEAKGKLPFRIEFK